MRTVRRVLLVVAALLMATPFLGPAAIPAAVAQTPTTTIPPTPQEKAVALTEPSIVYLSIDLQYYVDTGQSGFGYLGPYDLQGNCTGSFVSSDGYVETAGHCVDVAAGSALANAAIQQALTAELNNGNLTADNLAAAQSEALALWKVEGQAAGSAPQLTVSVINAVGVAGEQASAGKTARVVEVKPRGDGDVALLKTETQNAPVLLLGSDSDVSIGTAILSAGYPGAETGIVDPTLSPTFKDGQINAKTTQGDVRVPVYETSATLSPGMSGGPTVMLDAKLVGINSATSRASDSFNFISPVSLVKEQLTRNNVKNELGPVDLAYRAGLEAYYSGDYKLAVSKFDEALGIAPGLFYAQQFKQKANEKAASAPPTTTASSSSDSSSSSSLIWILLGGVVLIALVVIVVLLATRGRNKGGAATPPPQYATVGAPPPSPPPATTAQAAPAPPPGPPQAAPAPPPGPPQATPTAPMAPVSPPAGAPTAFCSSCGHQLEPDVHFCPSCGHDART